MEEKSKYKVKRDDRLGRYLVASKPIKEGTLIFTDIPFIVGPKPDSPVVCLGCHRFWNKLYFCSRCGWPCCNSICDNLTIHKNHECKVFVEANVRFQNVSDITKPCLQYDCITPLRMLTEKEKDSKRWEKEVTVMEDHNVERQKYATWEIDDINITQYLLGPCKLQDRFSEDLIQKVCGILEVNAVEIPLVYGPNIRGIYPKVAIMSHNCVPNIVHVIVSDTKNKEQIKRAEVWAACDIKENEKLELCYTHVLSCTLQRRAHLKESKFFDCNCQRCSDPTELGTHMSTIKCNKCDFGILLASNPLDEDSLWKCSECSYFMTSNDILKMTNLIQKEIAITEKLSYGRDEIDKREQDAKWYRNILHPNHALLISLKYTLAQMYGNVKGYMLNELNEQLLEQKINICEEVLRFLNTVSPGQTRMKGTILYEMHTATSLLYHIKFKEGKLDVMQLDKKLVEISKVLHKAAEILIREDENSDKGSLGRSAMKQYNDFVALHK